MREYYSLGVPLQSHQMPDPSPESDTEGREGRGGEAASRKGGGMRERHGREGGGVLLKLHSKHIVVSSAALAGDDRVRG